MSLEQWIAAARVASDNLRGRRWEPEVPWLGRVIGERSVCLHVGASNGRHTYAMARAAARGHVHAFEPSPHTFPVLQRVVRLHRLRNVTCHPRAVSDRAETVELSVPIKLGGELGHSFGYVRLDGSRVRRDLRFMGEQRHRVEAVTLDDFVAEHGLPRVDFVRIDVEGGEARVIPGARGVFERFLPDALVEFHPPILRDLFDTEPADLLRFFHELGYRCYHLEGGRLVRVERVIEELFRDYFLLHPSHGPPPSP